MSGGKQGILKRGRARVPADRCLRTVPKLLVTSMSSRVVQVQRDRQAIFNSRNEASNSRKGSTFNTGLQNAATTMLHTLRFCSFPNIFPIGVAKHIHHDPETP